LRVSTFSCEAALCGFPSLSVPYGTSQCFSVSLAGSPGNASKAETTVTKSVAESTAVAPIKVASPAPAPAAGKDGVFVVYVAVFYAYWLEECRRRLCSRPCFVPTITVLEKALL
jgi:hypothetical protein